VRLGDCGIDVKAHTGRRNVGDLTAGRGIRMAGA